MPPSIVVLMTWQQGVGTNQRVVTECARKQRARVPAHGEAAIRSRGERLTDPTAVEALIPEERGCPSRIDLLQVAQVETGDREQGRLLRAQAPPRDRPVEFVRECAPNLGGRALDLVTEARH